MDSPHVSDTLMDGLVELVFQALPSLAAEDLRPLLAAIVGLVEAELAHQQKALLEDAAAAAAALLDDKKRQWRGEWAEELCRQAALPG